MSLVAFVVNGTLLRDPRRFTRRCRAVAEERGWAAFWTYGPAGNTETLGTFVRYSFEPG